MITLVDIEKWLERASRTEVKVRIALRVLSEDMGEVECWVTGFALNTNGYPLVTIGGKVLLLHRVVYSLEYGPIPEGMCVLHKCDNPKCINPSHLFLGTKADNMQDKVSKGRQSHSSSKLVKEQVLEIRHRREQGTKIKELAEAFSVTQATISMICNRRTWKGI